MELEYQAEARREAARQAHELARVTRAQSMPALSFLFGAYHHDGRHDAPQPERDTHH